MSKEIIRAIVDIYESGGEAALVTLCRTTGSTPRKAGAKMLVYANGKTLGTIGGGPLEYQAVQKALKVIETKKPVLWERDLADEGMVCGGSGTVYIERIQG